MMEVRPQRIAAFATQALAGRHKQPVRLLATFARHVYLLVGEGDVGTMLILSPPSECMTPYTLMLASWPPVMEEYGLMWCDGQTLQLGEWNIGLQGATIWPSFVGKAHVSWQNIQTYPLLLQDVKKLTHQSDYLAAVADNPTRLDMPGWDGTQLALGLIRQDRDRIFAGASACVGLGRGLTPAGDDFLCGVMLAAHQVLPMPDTVCESIVDAAKGKTTTLSYAFLVSAAQGHVSEDWRSLLLDDALGQKQGARLGLLGAVIQHGYSSGADSLAGFVWALHVLGHGADAI